MVRTVIYSIQRHTHFTKLPSQGLVQLLELLLSYHPSSDDALISHDHQGISCLLEAFQGIWRPYRKGHISGLGQKALIFKDYPVTVKKDGPALRVASQTAHHILKEIHTHMLDILSALEKSGGPVLAVSAHADDVELACGGTIAKLTKAGIPVHHLILSLREIASPDTFSHDELVEETYAANEAIGIPRERVILHDLPNRTFPAQRQEILDILYKLGKELKPALILIPSQDDMHQDHGTLANECFRAFKDYTLLSYELPWNRIISHINCYVVLSEEEMNAKLASLAHYDSQVQVRNFFSERYIRSLAITRGMQVKNEYAEAFEVVRLIV